MLTDKNYKIVDFVLDVLKKKFPGNYAKQHIHDDDPEKLNFACPYCGDSEKNVGAKRGNLYLKSETYKCFNDGCLTYKTLTKFVTDFGIKYSLPIPNINLEAAKSSRNIIRIDTTKRGELIEFLMNPKVKDALLNFKDVQERFFLIPCKDAPADSPIGIYIDNRMIRELPMFEDTCYYDNRQDKIYLFNIDLRSGKVLGLSIRKIDSDGYGPKYNIKNYSDFKKTGLAKGISDDFILKIDTINNFYNILNINFNKPVKINEGQINAMFLNNSIATTGVTKSKKILGTLISKKNALIIFDNDKAGKDETAKLLQEGYTVFLWSKLIGDIRKKYPHHRNLINDINDMNDLYKFYYEVGDPVTYDEFNDLVDTYFSESVFDLISI